MTETPDMDRLRAKIRALFAKTIEAGATEAEAMTAAAKARELIDKYQVDMSIVEEMVRDILVFASTLEFAIARRLMHGIEAYCEVQTGYLAWGFHDRRVVEQ